MTTAEADERIRDFLGAEAPLRYLSDSHVDYAQRRYERGLEDFVDRLEAMGCPTDAQVLDIGSGAGNWSIAQGLRADPTGKTYGFDPVEGYVQLGNDIARLLGLKSVEFHVGSAEDPGAFRQASFAMTNSSMMWIDVDRFIPTLAMSVVPGARVYGNYTTSAARLEKAVAGLRKNDHKLVRYGLSTLFNSAMAKIGLKVHSQSFAITAAQMFELFRIYGFDLVDRPGLHDWTPTKTREGIVDFILERGDPDAIGEPEPTSDAIRRLFDAGAFAAVITATETPDRYSDDVLDYRARALVGAGRIDEAARLTPRLSTHALAPLVLAVQRFLEKTTSAETAHADIQGAHVADEAQYIQEFCLGIVGLRNRAAADARRHFEHAAELNPNWPGGWVGSLIAMIDEKSSLDAPFTEAFETMVAQAELGLLPKDRLKVAAPGAADAALSA